VGNNKRKILVLQGLPILMILLVISAQAQAVDPMPCEQDVARYCKSIVPGAGRVGKCLNENKLKVSGDCERYALALREQRKKLKTECYGDILANCKDILPGQGRVLSCLQSHKENISRACQMGLKSIGKLNHQK
jgi:hypothetical protein